MDPRTITFILNDRCPLRCAHCSVGFSDDHLGSGPLMDKAKLERTIASLAPNVYNMVVLAGGEPSLVPDLVTAAVDACRKVKILSAMTTAPFWARTLDGAHRFLGKISHPDFLILSFDKYHLDFITMDHYRHAIDAAREQGIYVALNICYTSSGDREAAYLQIKDIEQHLAGINYARVMPKGNALDLEEFSSESITINTEEDLERLPRSCSAGNAVVNRDFELHACCWSGDIPASPLRFSNDASVPQEVRSMDAHPIFQRVCGGGIIDGLSPGDKAELLQLVHGKHFVNECHLCITMMQQKIWTRFFNPPEEKERASRNSDGTGHGVCNPIFAGNRTDLKNGLVSTGCARSRLVVLESADRIE